MSASDSNYCEVIRQASCGTMKRFSNASLIRIGADKLIGTNYGKGTDNEQIALASGYQKVYDCGQGVYVLDL